MLLERLRWLLPALVVFWIKLESVAALPARDESSHVSANTFYPSVASSTMIRQVYNKRVHPPDGKNNTQSSHKLVASPAGLLRPDKFQFYTYNDKGDMITRQMTVQEIQGLIAAGGAADHVAMDRQEPQKADDVLTGGKKVMDVVQKVQNVLKSALDKPPAGDLTGSIPKIPEHANVEWSNILPSILSGEADAISPTGESNQLSHKLTTERIDAGNSGASSAEGALNIGTSVTSKSPTKPVISEIQTNAYAGFTNNMQHNEKPQIPLANIVSEKPMIPVPVITVMEQKLSTLQSTITESPIFQMLSVIPVDTAESAHKEAQTDSSMVNIGVSSSSTTQSSIQTEGFNQTERVELTLNEVPEDTTFSQLTSSDHPLNPSNITKQTATNLDNKVGQEMEAPAVYYSMITQSISTDPPSVDTKQTATHDKTGVATNMNDKISPSDASYILIQNKNNTKTEDSSFTPDVTKESQVNGTHNDQVIPQINTTTLEPVSHASAAEKPNETALYSSSTLVSRTEASTASTLSHTEHRLGESSSIVTKEPLSPVTPMFVENHLNSQPAEIHSSAPMEPLPTQLINSLSSVMSQVSEVKPPVLSLSSASNESPEMSIMNINYDQRFNVSDSDKIANTQHDTLKYHVEVNEERVSTQTYATISTKAPSQYTTARPIDDSVTQQSVVMTTNRELITNAGINQVSMDSRITASTTIAATSNGVTADNPATTPAGLNVESIGTVVLQMSSTASSPVRIQPEKTHDDSLENQTETPVILGTTEAALEKHALDEITSSQKILPTTSMVDTVAKIDTSESLKKPTPTIEDLNNALVNLNLSDPVSVIDQILNIAPIPSSIPTIESIDLPNDTANLLASGLASGLIAGFATTERSSIEEVNEDQTQKNVSSVSLDATKLAEFITKTSENVTEMYKETVGLNINDNYQKNENITYTQAPDQTTEEPFLIDSIENSTLGSIMKMKESNNTLATTEILTNERINDTIESSSSSPNKFVNDESKDSIEQSTIAAGIITMNPEQLSTMNIRISNVNKTLLDTNNNPIMLDNNNNKLTNEKKTENTEKMKTTEAPVVKTDASPESSQLPVKIELIDSDITNDTRISEHKIRGTEMLGEKNVSSATNETNDSTFHSDEYIRNVTTETDTKVASNVTSNIVIMSDENSTNSAFLQNPNRDNNRTTDYKDNDTNMTTLITPNTMTNNRTVVQNDKDNYNNQSSLSSSTSSSILKDATTDSSVVKVVTQESSESTKKGNKEELSQPILVNGTNLNLNPVKNISNQNNANISESSMKNASMQSNKQSNNTESKPASLKHSENPPKPDAMHLQLPILPPNPVPVPIQQTSKPTVHKPEEKSNITKTETEANTEEKWTLISQQLPSTITKPPKPSKPPKPTRKPINHVQTLPSNSTGNVNIRLPETEAAVHQQDQQESSMQSVLPLDASQSANGLDITVRHTSSDIVNFAKLCNELAFNFWVATNKGLSTARSLALSPFGMTSLLAMIFLGARGPTSDQMNEILRLDDVATFNPHLVFQNVTDTVSLARGQGIANAAFVRELFADKMKVRKLMPFYKEQAQQFYEGLVAEVNFATISDLVRRRTNLLIRKQTGGRIKDFVKTNTVPLRSPLAALSANVFQTDCNSTLTSSIGRDGELYFAVSPAVRQRKLVPVPATTWRLGVLAGYEPSIDATAVALGGSDKLVSTIFVLPGQQGHTAPGDTLDRLEQRLVRSAFHDGAWNKLLKVLIPRNGLELQVPKFSHRSVINATAALKRMGLDELFSGNADFKGINGIGHRLHLADVLQMNLFSTCGDENILSGRHHIETYPATPLRRNIKRQMEDNFGNIAKEDTSRHSGASSQEDHITSFYADRSVDRLYREKRQISGSSERPRLKLDRPFLYFVRHNPSGIILHMGRFNPRLLP